MKDQIDKALALLLQRDVKLMLGTKIIRQGKLLIYTINEYIITVTFKNPKKQVKVYDVYYPYNIYHNSNKDLVFDYSLEELTGGKIDMMESLLSIGESQKTHKLFNSKLKFVVDTAG